MKHGFTWQVLLIFTIIICGQVKIHILHPLKNRGVVRYVQEKNCGANCFDINSYQGCVPGYYSTVCVPAREIWV